jgi:hypothetical protein
VIFAPVKVMDGSSAIRLIRRAAQPSWASTLFGSYTPSLTYLPERY